MESVCDEMAPQAQAGNQADILSVEQLAQFLGVSALTIHGLTRNRARVRDANPIPHLKLGKRLYFRRTSVEAWLLQKEGERSTR